MAALVLTAISLGAYLFWQSGVLRQEKNYGRPRFQFSTMINIGDLATPGGNVFIARSGDGRFICQAHFIFAISSRQNTNSNQLEFYCRDLSQAPRIDFNVKTAVVRPSGSQASLAYFNGRLVNFNRRAADVAKGSPRHFVRTSDGRYLIFADRYPISPEVTCEGTSIVDGEGRYYGSILMDSYATAYQGRVIFDRAGDLYATPELEPAGVCALLASTLLRRGVGWPYAAVNYDGALYIGGSGFPANLYRVGPDMSVELLPLGVSSTEVSEIYSFTVHNGDLLFGTFPTGDVFRVSRSGVVERDGIFAAGPGNWTYPETDIPYRESQSIISAYGMLWAGMYPWGEVMMDDAWTEFEGRRRLFEHPERTEAQVPYINEARKQIEKFWSGDFDHIGSFRTARTVYEEGDELPRILGIFKAAWGQRVQQIVVTNGSLCASTGSMSLIRYEPDVHTHLSRDSFEDYGRVWCAALDGQALADTKTAGPHEATFRIYDEGVGIEVGGERVIAPFSLGADVAAAFADGDFSIETQGANVVVREERWLGDLMSR